MAHTIDCTGADHPRADDNDSSYDHNDSRYDHGTNDDDHRYQHARRDNDPAHRESAGECRCRRSTRAPDKDERLQARSES